MTRWATLIILLTLASCMRPRCGEHETPVIITGPGPNHATTSGCIPWYADDGGHSPQLEYGVGLGWPLPTRMQQVAKLYEKTHRLIY